MRERDQASVPGDEPAPGNAQQDVGSRERTDLDVPGETVAGGPTGTEDFDAFGATEAGASSAEQPPEGRDTGRR
ncbi:MAG: hypothetical protein M3301_06270 [Chloroflexota bacterium]|nr:hypothetical protein [Chloroflexota bacterium]